MTNTPIPKNGFRLHPILSVVGLRLDPVLPLHDSFELPVRERVAGKDVPNHCGRDFGWLCLHRFNPSLWNLRDMPPHRVTSELVFGDTASTLCGLAIANLHAVLAGEGLRLAINGSIVQSRFDFFCGVVRPRLFPSANDAIERVRGAIAAGHCCGIDVAAGLGGLMNHVMFVAGVAEDGLLVFDTHQVPSFGYQKCTAPYDPRCAMLLSFDEIRERWGCFGRVWEVAKI